MNHAARFLFPDRGAGADGFSDGQRFWLQLAGASVVTRRLQLGLRLQPQSARPESTADLIDSTVRRRNCSKAEGEGGTGWPPIK